MVLEENSMYDADEERGAMSTGMVGAIVAAVIGMITTLVLTTALMKSHNDKVEEQAKQSVSQQFDYNAEQVDLPEED